MEDELVLIALGRIGMVEEMVDEVERISYYGGSRVQVVHKSRDEGSMKISFEKLHESSLFLFLTQAPLLFHEERVLPRWDLSLIKGRKRWHRSLTRDSGSY